MTIYGVWQRFWLLFISIIPFGWIWSDLTRMEEPWGLRLRVAEAVVYSVFVLRTLLARLTLTPQTVSYHGVFRSWSIGAASVRSVDTGGFLLGLGNAQPSGGMIKFRDDSHKVHWCAIVAMRSSDSVQLKLDKIVAYFKENNHAIEIGSS